MASDVASYHHRSLGLSVQPVSNLPGCRNIPNPEPIPSEGLHSVEGIGEKVAGNCLDIPEAAADAYSAGAVEWAGELNLVEMEGVGGSEMCPVELDFAKDEGFGANESIDVGGRIDNRRLRFFSGCTAQSDGVAVQAYEHLIAVKLEGSTEAVRDGMILRVNTPELAVGSGEVIPVPGKMAEDSLNTAHWPGGASDRAGAACCGGQTAIFPEGNTGHTTLCVVRMEGPLTFSHSVAPLELMFTVNCKIGKTSL